MADGFKAKLDLAQWDAAYAALRGQVKESLIRRMLVEGGVLLRDAAKAGAPTSDPPYNPTSRGSQASGALRKSIYLAYDTNASTDTIFQYTISWNSKIPHFGWYGKFIEFGWWQTHAIGKTVEGYFFTDMSRPLAKPIWHAPKPFLRPAMSKYGNVAVTAMLARGEREFPKLMQEHAQS